MDPKTEQGIAASQEIGAEYDAMAKRLFSNREILSPVLKEVVSEFQDSTYEEIAGYIDPSSITSDPVDDLSVITKGTTTEMSSPVEKTIHYDTRFRAINPKLTTSELQFYLHIDLEVQNDYKPSNPTYPVIKRAIYYGAREISAQLGILTEETNYAALQKAYSIWICNKNIPSDLKNTVTKYVLTRQDVIGRCDEPTADFDLLEIVIIRRGNDAGKETIFDYLTGIFTANLKKLEPYIGKNENAQKEVRSMSGLGRSIYNDGKEEGIAIGEARGEARAAAQYKARIAELEAQLSAVKAR